MKTAPVEVVLREPRNQTYKMLVLKLNISRVGKICSIPQETSVNPLCWMATRTTKDWSCSVQCERNYFVARAEQRPGTERDQHSDRSSKSLQQITSLVGVEETLLKNPGWRSAGRRARATQTRPTAEPVTNHYKQQQHLVNVQFVKREIEERWWLIWLFYGRIH